jgi:hypothetical protein
MSSPASPEFPRDLTERESAVLDALLAALASPPDTSRLQVSSRCACGCPTVHFTEEPRRNHLLAEAVGPGEPQMQVLLFGDDAGLNSLELVFGEGEEEFPPPESLTDIRARTS